MATILITLFALVLLATVFCGVIWAVSAAARFLSALLPAEAEHSNP